MEIIDRIEDEDDDNDLHIVIGDNEIFITIEQAESLYNCLDDILYDKRKDKEEEDEDDDLFGKLKQWHY